MNNKPQTKRLKTLKKLITKTKIQKQTWPPNLTHNQIKHNNKLKNQKNYNTNPNKTKHRNIQTKPHPKTYPLYLIPILHKVINHTTKMPNNKEKPSIYPFIYRSSYLAIYLHVKKSSPHNTTKNIRQYEPYKSINLKNNKSKVSKKQTHLFTTNNNKETIYNTCIYKTNKTLKLNKNKPKKSHKERTNTMHLQTYKPTQKT